MDQPEIYKNLDADILHECLKCRVESECSTRSKKCGIRRGIKYGLYPESAMKRAKNSLPREVASQITRGVAGVPDKPLWGPSDGMAKFSEAVAKYEEPWMGKWELR